MLKESYYLSDLILVSSGAVQEKVSHGRKMKRVWLLLAPSIGAPVSVSVTLVEI